MVEFKSAPNGMSIDEFAERANDASTLLKSMANQHRLMVLCRLGEGECSVTQLHSEISVSQSALSQHLAVLRAQGLVGTRRAGQQVFYHIKDPDVLQVISTFIGIFCEVDEG